MISESASDILRPNHVASRATHEPCLGRGHIQNQMVGRGAMAEDVDYRCAQCGSIETFTRIENGISCKACGSRIFSKLRRTGYKVLQAE